MNRNGKHAGCVLMMGVLALISGLMLTMILLLLANPNADARAEDASTMTVCGLPEGKYLRGRRAPSLNADEEMRLYNGDKVTVLEVRDGWAKIRGGESSEVWCSLDYLTSEQPEAMDYTVTATGRVRVRTAPDGELKRWAADGDRVTVTRWVGKWGYVGDGYILSKYLVPCADKP